MARMATRMASGLAAAGIATLMSVAPAQAKVADPEGGGCVGASCNYTPASTTPADDTPWLQIVLGAAGGIAVVGAGVATVTSRSRREPQQPHPA